jgi:hypothetical protein
MVLNSTETLLLHTGPDKPTFSAWKLSWRDLRRVGTKWHHYRHKHYLYILVLARKLM